MSRDETPIVDKMAKKRPAADSEEDGATVGYYNDITH